MALCRCKSKTAARVWEISNVARRHLIASTIHRCLLDNVPVLFCFVVFLLVWGRGVSREIEVRPYLQSPVSMAPSKPTLWAIVQRCINWRDHKAFRLSTVWKRVEKSARTANSVEMAGQNCRIVSSRSTTMMILLKIYQTPAPLLCWRVNVRRDGESILSLDNSNCPGSFYPLLFRWKECNRILKDIGLGAHNTLHFLYLLLISGGRANKFPIRFHRSVLPPPP